MLKALNIVVGSIGFKGSSPVCIMNDNSAGVFVRGLNPLAGVRNGGSV